MNTPGDGFNSQMLSLQNKEPKLNYSEMSGNSSEGVKSGDANKSLTIPIDETIAINSDKDPDVLGKFKHFKENKIYFFCHNKLLQTFKEEEGEKVDEAIERFCGMYRDNVVKGTKFIGLEKDGVFVGSGLTKDDNLFLGRREGSSMFGFLSCPKTNDFFVGYFKMNDKGEIKHAGIFSGPSNGKCCLSIKTGPDKVQRTFLEISSTIGDVYKGLSANKTFQKLENYDTLTTQVASMFKDLKDDFDSPEFKTYFKCFPAQCNIPATSKFCSVINTNECFNELKDFLKSGPKVYPDVFSFPIYFNGEQRKGLLYFVGEGKKSFDLCFGLQAFENGTCVFVPLLVILFSEDGQSYLLFDDKNYSNSCKINYGKVDSSFYCNLSFPKDKEIIINNKLGDNKVYIASPLKGNKIQYGVGSGHSLHGLIQASELSFNSKGENKDFFLQLSFADYKSISLRFPCFLKKASINFSFFSFGYCCCLKDSIKKGDEVIDTLDNFILVCEDRVFLFDGCSNTDILNVEVFNKYKLKKEFKFYYPQKDRSVDSFFDFLNKITKAIYFVEDSGLPFIMSLEGFKEGNWHKDVDKETGNFLTDVFSNAKVETNSINEDVKELDNKDTNQEEEKKTSNDIRIQDTVTNKVKMNSINEDVKELDNKDINQEEEKKTSNDTGIQDTVTNKIITYTNKDKRKSDKRRRCKKNNCNILFNNKKPGIEFTKSIGNSNLCKKQSISEEDEFKPGDVVPVEYFVHGCKDPRNIKHIIEYEKKKFFGEKRRIVILPNVKKMPHKFTYKGSVSNILESGEKDFPKIHKLLSRVFFNLSCAKILKDSSIELSKIKNVKIGNRDVFEVYIAHNNQTEIGNQVRLIVAYDKAEKTFYVLDSLCHYDK